MDPQSAALFGQQSSQPFGFPGGSQKGGGNEDLALALAAMASSPSVQNAVLGGGLTDTGGTNLQTSMIGGFAPTSQSGDVSSIFGNINTGVNAVKTGAQLYGLGSSLYNAIVGGPDWEGISAAGDALTTMNLANDLSQVGSNLDYADAFNWGTW